jgi:hypothetical protein
MINYKLNYNCQAVSIRGGWYAAPNRHYPMPTLSQTKRMQ